MATQKQNTDRILVLGTSGSGKTTVAKEVAQILDITHVEFDSYRHGPNWTETPDAIFREQLSQALRGETWVADGNYSVARDVVWPRATTIIWLDYSIHIVMWRLFWRIMRRGILREELWNGNREKFWWHFVTRQSLFLWVLKTHGRPRKTLPAAFAQAEPAHLEVIHLRSPTSTREWVADLG
jgi:energy-coupling factor transporter ATP-binding protein EcfA2